MTSEPFSNIKYIAEALDPNELLANATLGHLSNLSGSELDFLKESWPRTDAGRKRQVISQLVQLSHDNFRLNFNDIFVYCLYDTDSKVRASAIAGLAEEENYHYIPPLVHSLLKDSSVEVRETAAIALGNFALQGEIGKLSTASINRIYDALLEVWDDKSAGPEIKRLVLEAIAPLTLPRVKSLIEEAYRSNDVKLKISAVRAMGRNCDPLWLTALVDSLDSDNKDMRYEAAHALGDLALEEALPYLIKLLKDENARIQEAAIRALGEIGNDESKQELNTLSRSPQQHIRRAAKTAFKELDFCEELLSPNR